MGCFKLPEYLFSELEFIISKFWWCNGKKDEIHWVKCYSLCESKRDVGIGFRHLSSFNLVMLGKQVWHIIEHPDSLPSRLLKAKYFPNCDVFEAMPNPNASFTWKSVFGSIDLVNKGPIWHISNGETVSVWKRNWITGIVNRKLLTLDLFNIEETTVSNFLEVDGLGWDKTLLECVFWECDIEAILQILISKTNSVDTRQCFF